MDAWARGALLLGLLALLPACRDASSGSVIVEEAPGPVWVPPPPYVFGGLRDVGPDVFADLRWGVDQEGTLRSALHLERYEVTPATWGTGERTVPVLEVRTARQSSTTAFLFDPGTAVLRTVVVRDLPEVPPLQENVFGFLDHLGAFPGKVLVCTLADEARIEGMPDQFLLFPGQGVKVGLGDAGDGQLYLDHVEYYDPDWSIDQLAEFKYGGQLQQVGTITAAERR